MKEQKAYSVNDASGLNCNSVWLPGRKAIDYEKLLCTEDENKDTNKVYREDNQVLDKKKKYIYIYIYIYIFQFHSK